MQIATRIVVHLFREQQSTSAKEFTSKPESKPPGMSRLKLTRYDQTKTDVFSVSLFQTQTKNPISNYHTRNHLNLCWGFPIHYQQRFLKVPLMKSMGWLRFVSRVVMCFTTRNLASLWAHNQMSFDKYSLSYRHMCTASTIVDRNSLSWNMMVNTFTVSMVCSLRIGRCKQ